MDVGGKMTVEELLEETRKLYNDNEYQKAIDVCNEILKMDFNNQTALGYKAKCLYLSDKLDEALNLSQNAITLYPNNYHYFNIMSDVFMEMEEYDKALECFDRIFEIGVADEVELDFIRQDYEACLRLRIDQLIEREKYADAWECFNRLSEQNLKRSEKISEFMRFHVKPLVRAHKSRLYHVRASSEELKAELMEFLDENGFECNDLRGMLFLIDVVDKTCRPVSVDENACEIISISKFYDKVNYCPKSGILRKQLHDESGNLVYGGYTLDSSPYGFGTAYFSNGNVYREGIFDIKGIVQGKEYYPSGQIRFEGQWCLTRGYGPNAPCDGNAYSENGDLIYSGKFEIKRGGVGWPMIQKPKGFFIEQKDRPKIDYL